MYLLKPLRDILKNRKAIHPPNELGGLLATKVIKD
jgi:hypothetical protein